MIKKIKLVNWKTHKNSELEFSEGTNVIVGINGAGKSSIMDAISFALFGTFPKLLSRKQKLDDLITNKPQKANEARIKLEFFFNGKEYSVLRVLERGKGTTYSEIRVKTGEKDILLESVSSQRVTDEIKKILKIDYELFSRAIYSEQNGIDYFIELSPGDRAKKIDNLLRIDNFEKARSSVVTLKTKLEGEKIALQNTFKEDNIRIKEMEIEELKNKIILDENTIKENSKEAENLKIQILNMQKRIDDIEQKIMEQKRLEEKIFHLKKDLDDKKSNYNKIKNIIGDEDLEKMNKKLSSFIDQINKLEKEYSQINFNYEKVFSEKTRMESERESLEKRNKEIEKKIDKLKEYIFIYDSLLKKYNNNIMKILDEKRKQLQEINSMISVLEYKKNENENISLQIEKLENKCPVCGSDINVEKKKHLMHLKEKENQDLINQINLNQNEKKIIELEIKKLEEDFKKIEESKKYVEESENIKKEFYENENRIKEIDNILPFLQSNFKKIKDQMEDIKIQIEKTKDEKLKIQSIIEKFNELLELEEKIKNLEQEINISIQDKSNLEKYLENENYVELKKNFENMKSRFTEIKTLVSEKEKNVNERKYQLEKMIKELNLIKEQKNYILKLENILRNLSIFELSLERTQNQLREEFIETVNKKMSEIWPDLYPYADYNDIRLFVDEGNYILQLLTSTGDWINVENVSGGESTMACLALRIAFSLVLVPHLNWLILDEPTHNLDEKSVLNLNETLRDRIKDFVSQVFIITHDKHLENAASGELYRINRNKDEDGYSEIVRVTEI
ncbi:MAG: AAA family ATPase [Candidatus Aenigmatarchaeota archaeon]